MLQHEDGIGGFVFKRLENIVGKIENTGYPVFSIFPTIFSNRFSSQGRLSRHGVVDVLTLSQTTILDSSKLKEFADDNFKFDKKGRKFFQLVENTVGKGEIARYEQFLLFPQCFQKTLTADT